jgi:hypothetical protein
MIRRYSVIVVTDERRKTIFSTVIICNRGNGTTQQSTHWIRVRITGMGEYA